MLDLKTYNLLIIFELQKKIRNNEPLEFFSLLNLYDIKETDTSKQIYQKLCLKIKTKKNDITSKKK